MADVQHFTMGIKAASPNASAGQAHIAGRSRCKKRRVWQLTFDKESRNFLRAANRTSLSVLSEDSRGLNMIAIFEVFAWVTHPNGHRKH